MPGLRTDFHFGFIFVISLLTFRNLGEEFREVQNAFYAI
jgi:hypothetical protein